MSSNGASRTPIANVDNTEIKWLQKRSIRSLNIPHIRHNCVDYHRNSDKTAAQHSAPALKLPNRQILDKRKFPKHMSPSI